MGLRMTMQRWWYHGLHFFLALSLPFVFALLAGCMKIEEETPDYGPEVSGDAIDLALGKAINGANFDGIGVGRNLRYVTTRRIENEEFITLLATTDVEVIARKDVEDSDEVRFTLKITKSERLDSAGKFETVVSTEDLVLRKASLVGLNNTRAMSKAVEAFSGKKVVRESYHRLREFTERQAPPNSVVSRPGCGGLDPCELVVKYIQFDLVQWYDDGSSQKVAFFYGFSTQTPYLPFGNGLNQFTGLMTKNCAALYVPVEGRTVYVRDCQDLENFQL